MISTPIGASATGVLGRPGLRRRSLLLVAAAATSWPARAQPAYPARPVRLLVPYPAGSGPDQLARLLARPLQDILGQPFIVENRPGALGVVGTANAFPVSTCWPSRIPASRPP